MCIVVGLATVRAAGIVRTASMSTMLIRITASSVDGAATVAVVPIAPITSTSMAKDPNVDFADGLAMARVARTAHREPMNIDRAPRKGPIVSHGNGLNETVKTKRRDR